MTVPITPDDTRGQTSAQIKAAAPGSLFIIHNMRALGWFTELAKALGREDLRFTTVSVLEHGAAYLMQGKYIAAGLDTITVDHWAAEHLTADQSAGLALVREMAAVHATQRNRV